MKQIKNILSVIIYPILFLLGELIINYGFVYSFNKHQLRLLKNRYPFWSHQQLLIKLQEIMKTAKYKNSLNDYMISKALFIALITSMIFIPLFINIYNQYKKKRAKKLSYQNIAYISLLGVSISLIYNITFNNLNNIFHFTNNFKLSTIPLYIQIITSGIMGPIIEELLFRGIVYNKLKKKFKTMPSIIWCSILFSLFHIGNILNMLYAFAISFVFIYVYEKHKTLTAPIITHISANISVIIMMYIILKQIVWLNILILFIMIILLLFIYVMTIKKDYKKYN